MAEDSGRTDDLLMRLRNWSPRWTQPAEDLMADAADTIETLRRELAEANARTERVRLAIRGMD